MQISLLWINPIEFQSMGHTGERHSCCWIFINTLEEVSMTELNFTRKSFDLLEGLAANNDKSWYDAHRKDFEAYLREPFSVVLERATDRLAETTLPLAGGSKTMFRQNRDIRFSKDKSPYSTHVSGVLTPSGTKAEKDGMLYVQLDGSGGLIACGFYKLKAAELATLRDKIIEEPEAFSQVLQGLNDAGLSLSDEDKLTSMPRGYEAHDQHEYAQYLRLKSFISQTPLPKSAWLEADIVDRIVEYAKGCASLLKFGRACDSEN
ncbi:DUF2461 domain-containing protein [Pseudanabaena sp. FACHB-2040]|uniref:DUF2461 domain-containing protein n=1 Tax=Pseudanabaena sp. FACHB-2040 TaxID=2692859 RepID=UPI001688BEBB|nr:DUF2461 domain-containing protein [Pseudanabaena sp. FACHB-2040]MBD2258275.1 DUF2461 domain-containing protein [Pseudanabaena sp. FACHB-2040]